MKIRLARLLFVRLIRSRQWGSRNVNKLISHAKAEWRYPPKDCPYFHYVTLESLRLYWYVCALLLWGTATFRWSHLYQLDVNFINWMKEIWWYLWRQWVPQICIRHSTRWWIKENPLSYPEYSLSQRIPTILFPHIWIMVPRFNLADGWPGLTGRPSHARPEWARDPSITDSDSGGSSSSDPDSGSGWPAGVASYLASPARHVTASLRAWLLSSQPAVHPDSIRLRSGPRTLGKVCGQLRTPLLTCWQPAAHSQKINSPRLGGYAGRYFWPRSICFGLRLKAVMNLSRSWSSPARHTWHLCLCT